MSPTEIKFKAIPAKSCRGCLCQDEKSETCRNMAHEARARGLPDCDDAKGYIYVADEVDPRQMTLPEVES
jgi:hypothetical protein